MHTKYFNAKINFIKKILVIREIKSTNFKWN